MTNTKTAPFCSALHPRFVRYCTLPAGHSGYHGDGDITWAGPMTRTGSRLDVPARYSCGSCGLTFPDVFGADQCCSVDPAHCATCWEVETATRPRERWTFHGRDWTADGTPFYVWRLYNLDKSVNSVWVAPVSDLLRPWVAEREGE